MEFDKLDTKRDEKLDNTKGINLTPND